MKTLLKGLAMQVQTPFAWLVEHLNLLGWPVVCIAVYKFARFLDQMQTRAAVVEDNINNIASNHLSHMQNSLESIDQTLKRQDSRWEAYITAQAAHNKRD